MFGIDKCPLCGSTSFIYKRDSGEVICKNCGYVVKVMNIDMRPERRRFEGDDIHESRTGLPESPLIVDSGTVLANYLGKKTIPTWDETVKVRRMKRIVKMSMNYNKNDKERNLYKPLTTLWNMGGKLKLPINVLRRAAEIYRMVMMKDLIRGRKSKILVAASIYLALRELGIPRPMKEVARELDVKEKYLGKYYRVLLKELGINVPLTNPSLFVKQITSKLGLPGDVAILAEKILRLARERRITAGKNPVTLASASVYYASLMKGYNITHNKVAVASGVTEVSVRNTCNRMLRDLDFNNINELREIVERDDNLKLTIHADGGRGNNHGVRSLNNENRVW